jgi:hypothetical protein
MCVHVFAVSGSMCVRVRVRVCVRVHASAVSESAYEGTCVYTHML